MFKMPEAKSKVYAFSALIVFVLCLALLPRSAKADENALLCPSMTDISSFTKAGIVPTSCEVRLIEAVDVQYQVGILRANYVAKFQGTLNRNAARPTLYSVLVNNVWQYAIVDPVILPSATLEVSQQ